MEGSCEGGGGCGVGVKGGVGRSEEEWGGVEDEVVGVSAML